MDDFDQECINDFIEESIENLDLLDDAFVIIEKEPGKKEELDKIFRAIHTMKGGARLIGMESIEGVSHEAESLLDRARSGDLLLVSDHITLLLKTMDVLRGMIEYIRDKNEDPGTKHESLIEELVKAGEGIFSNEEPASVEVEAVEAPSESEVVEEGALEPKVNAVQEERVSEDKKVLDDSEEVAPQSNSTHEPAAESTIRIDVKRLDRLMDLVGELVLSRNSLKRINDDLGDPSLNATSSNISLLTSELQEEIMNSRLQPISTVLNRFQRTVRDLAHSLNKEVELKVTGGGTELDRTLLESIKDPLTHLIRNAMDHGIETPEKRKEKGKSSVGTLGIHCFHEGGQVSIDIVDDGAGMDPDRISEKAMARGLVTKEELSRMKPKDIFRFIFQPGFSTAESLSSVSGRGVGMDVVHTNITAIGGSIELESTLGKGSKIHLQIPLTLAIIPALMIRAADRSFAIPQSSLKELILLSRDDFSLIESFDGTEVFRLRGELLPLLRVRELMELPEEELDHLFVVVLGIGDNKFGLLVDEVDDTEEIVVKPLAKFFSKVRLFSGATILGDGSISLIVDIDALGQMANLRGGVQNDINNSSISRTMAASTALLFDLGKEEVFGVQLSQVSRLEEIKIEDLEFSGEQEVLQYRGGILPVVRLSRHMDVKEGFSDTDRLTLIVFGLYGREAGLLVRNIIDAHPLQGDLDTTVIEDPFLLGTMNFNDQVILMLDGMLIFDRAFPQWAKGRQMALSSQGGEAQVLFVDDSPFYRKVVKKYLSDAGLKVDLANDGLEGLEKIKEKNYDLVVVDFEMPNMDGLEMVNEVRKVEGREDLPILVLTSLTGGKDRENLMNSGIQSYLVKLNKEELLSETHRLLELNLATV